MRSVSPSTSSAHFSLRAGAFAACRPLALATAALAPGLATTALADGDAPAKAEEPTALDEMTVEGGRAPQVASPKFTQPLVDTPQTVVAIPAEIFTQQNAATLSDVLRNTPGITFAAGEGGNVASGDSFFMRGYDTSGNIFIDGVRDTSAASRDTFNLEQVEIVKGPAGADNGRGGTGGYVNLVTKLAKGTPVHAASAQFGSAGVFRSTLDYNEPLAGGAAVRLNAVWHDGGVPGRDHVSNTRWGVAPSFSLGLAGATRASLGFSYVRQDNLPDSGLPIVAVPGGAVLPAGVPALTEEVSQSNFYGLVREDFEKVTSRAATAKIEHDFSKDLKFVYQTRLASTDRDALTTYFQNSSTAASTFPAATTPVNPATGAPPAGYTTWVPATNAITPRRIRNITENEIVAHHASIVASVEAGGLRHDVSSGIEAAHETQFTPTWSPTGAPSTNLFAPDAGRAATAAQTPYLAANRPYADADIDSAAAWLFDTVHLGSRWLLNASVRAERYEIDYRSLAAATPSAPAPVETKLSADDTLLSWKTGLVFKPTPRGSVYAAVGNSFTPPGASFALSATANNQNNPNVDPQESRNLEAGVKWEFFDGRLSTSAALYRSENFNLVSTDAATGQATQDISQLTQGVELGVSGKITPEWLVFGGVGFIDSEYRAGGTTSSANDGAELRFTPRLSGNLWTTYSLGRGVTVGGGVQYSDSVVRSTANSITSTNPSLASVPSYWLVNLMAAYQVHDRLTLRLNVNNAADANYFRLNNNGGRYYPGTPRSFTLTADATF